MEVVESLEVESSLEEAGSWLTLYVGACAVPGWVKGFGRFGWLNGVGRFGFGWRVLLVACGAPPPPAVAEGKGAGHEPFPRRLLLLPSRCLCLCCCCIARDMT